MNTEMQQVENSKYIY